MDGSWNPESINSLIVPNVQQDGPSIFYGIRNYAWLSRSFQQMCMSHTLPWFQYSITVLRGQSLWPWINTVGPTVLAPKIPSSHSIDYSIDVQLIRWKIGHLVVLNYAWNYNNPQKSLLSFKENYNLDPPAIVCPHCQRDEFLPPSFLHFGIPPVRAVSSNNTYLRMSYYLQNPLSCHLDTEGNEYRPEPALLQLEDGKGTQTVLGASTRRMKKTVLDASSTV